MDVLYFASNSPTSVPVFPVWTLVASTLKVMQTCLARMVMVLSERDV